MLFIELIFFKREKYEDGIGDSPQRSNMKVYNEHLKNYSETKDKILHTCKIIEK